MRGLSGRDRDTTCDRDDVGLVLGLERQRVGFDRADRIDVGVGLVVEVMPRKLDVGVRDNNALEGGVVEVWIVRAFDFGGAGFFSAAGVVASSSARLFTGSLAKARAAASSAARRER